MLKEIFNKVGIVVLSAGRGTRLKCTDKPKVMLEIGKRPIVSYVVEVLQKIGFSKEQVCLVVGFQKEKVINYFKDEVSFAEQEKQLGTAHAAYTGVCKLPKDIETVLIINGDDSAFYTEETIIKFIKKHLEKKSFVSVLTAIPENCNNFGRIIREENGEIKIVEKENLTEEQKNIKEISTGTICLDRDWFEKVFHNIKPMKGLGEYGLPDVLKEAKKENKTVQALKLENNNEWFGINIPEELKEADKRKTN